MLKTIISRLGVILQQMSVRFLCMSLIAVPFAWLVMGFNKYVYYGLMFMLYLTIIATITPFMVSIEPEDI